MNRRVWLFGLLVVLGCGGGSTEPDENNGDTNPPPGGSVKVFTATINGAQCSGAAGEIVGAYLGGNLTITAGCGQRSFSISALNLNAPSTITFGQGNQWSALAQVITGGAQGTYSTGFGGTGTLTLTTATLFRITGTFSFTAYTVAGGGLGQPVVTVQNGTFDISNP
jgi:hypothetical protein